MTLRAQEIRDESCHGHLSAKAQSCQLPQAQVTPKMPFGIGGGFAKLTGTLPQLVQVLPLPNPPLRLLRKGGGLYCNGYIIRLRRKGGSLYCNGYIIRLRRKGGGI
jgi:hypothetical protein